MKRALITGITGQDGSYLADLLLTKGYRVYGLVRRSATDPFENIQHLLSQIELITGDLSDSASIAHAIRLSQPNEVYNLGAQSFVGASWDLAEMTGDVTGLGVVRLLEAVRAECPSARVYQASSSEMFGLAEESPQNENTRFHPRSPYGIAKLYGHYATVNYRDSYGLFACSGILFNHESPRRGIEFVTRKIARGAARIKLGIEDVLVLGNLESERDWGFAGDYVEAMWLMLQQDRPEDFVIGMGVTQSVREFADMAFSYLGLDYRKHILHDPKLLRPTEVPQLCADASKAKKLLGWRPIVRCEQLIEMMVNSELDYQSEALHVKRDGLCLVPAGIGARRTGH